MATRAAEIEAAGGARLDGRVAFITGAGSGMGRAMAGQPRDVAKLAAFLASDDARFIHGASVCIDGGWTIE
jgi:3-oxoacyl-[acyl-carrier protein] reductase